MLSPNGIRAIFFDLDGTLRFNRPSGRDYFMDYAATLGMQTSRDQRALVWRWEHYYWANSPDLLQDEAKYPDRDTFWLNYSRRQLIAMGRSAEQAEQLAPLINGHMSENYKPENWVDPSTFDTLAELKAAGYLMGVISNRDLPFNEELKQLGLDDYFTLSVSGGEAGSKKPEAGIFHFALSRAGIRPDQTMYVGDNYFADVVGARNAGVNPVLLDIGGIFHLPGCPSIKSLAELPGILGHLP
jgi:HAD superfamily hydrolase (TIGR01549 family)